MKRNLHKIKKKKKTREEQKNPRKTLGGMKLGVRNTGCSELSKKFCSSDKEKNNINNSTIITCSQHAESGPGKSCPKDGYYREEIYGFFMVDSYQF